MVRIDARRPNESKDLHSAAGYSTNKTPTQWQRLDITKRLMLAPGAQTDLRARSDRGPGRRLIVWNAPGEKLDGVSTEVAGCTGDENFGHTFGPKSLVSLDRESGKVGRVKSAPNPRPPECRRR